MVDFDDTLSLTEEATFNIENIIAKKLGFEPMARAAHQANWGKPVKAAIVERIPGIDPDKFMIELQKTLPDFVKDGLLDVVDEDNVTVLEQLRNEGKHLAILTSRSMAEAKHLLDESHHLNRYVEKIYHTDNSAYLKPDPRVFDAILEEFQTERNETVYIGDSPSDGIAAKGANIHFIAVLESGLRTKKDFDNISVDFFADTFPESLGYIDKN